MPNFNIRWKGYPHHRLPRIRVVSARRNSVHSRSFSTSGQSSGTHSQIKNGKDNKKRPFGIQFRRRRVRGSRAPSSVARARRRASLRARHNIQVFGWDTPGAELASKVTTEETESSHRTPYRRSRSGATLRPEPQDDSAIPSTDGATSSVVRRLNPPKRKSENAYSLRHIARVPVYWTADHPSKQGKSTFNPDRLYSAQRSGPLQAASNRIPSHRPTEGSRTYDTRIGPLSPIASQRQRASTRPQFKPNTFRKSTTQVSPTRKDTGLGSPEFWEAVRDYSQQSNARGKTAASLKSVVRSLVSETASRSPSQRKVLARFTKGIELYLQAAKEHPSQSLASSISSTTISAYTIQQLKPYRSEFQSAGLAVTSAEQRGMAKLQKGLTPPPTPPKDDNYEKSRLSPIKRANDTQKPAQKGKLPSYASGSTGTTVLGWTPPHEKPYGRPPMVERRKSSASTEHTIIGFTPPHEMYASPPRPAREASAPPQSSPKKSLPWLRRPDTSPEASPTKKLSVASVKPEQHRPSTPLGGWVATFDIVEPLEPRKKSQPEVDPRPSMSKRPTEAKWEDLRYSTRKSTANNYMSKVVTEMATQTSPVRVGSAEDPKPIRPQSSYVDIGTQTVELSPVASRRDTVHGDQIANQPDDRAPVPSSRSKTFPLKSNNCKGDCVQPTIDPLRPDPHQRSSRPSKVMWKGVDQEIQATEIEAELQDEPESAGTQKQPSFRSSVVPGERTRTFPFTTSPSRHIGPYQPPQTFKSPNKSVDEAKSEWVPNGAELNETVFPRSESRSIASPRRHSPPPLCTQCAGPLNPETKPEAAITPEPELQPPAHACTARSSTQCQQCFPSRNSSVAISPLQVGSPIEVRVPVEVQYFSSRRSTRPIIPTRQFEYPAESSGPPEFEAVLVDSPKNYHTPGRKQTQSKAEPGLVDTPKSYHSPERKRTQSKAELVIEEYTRQEPMADPMKRPSLPRLKMKPVNSDPPKHVHCYSTVSRPKTRQQMPRIPAIDARPFPTLASTVSNDSCSLKSGDVNDKQVFKGLHVATAAACDEDIDKWIEEITGSSARKFLSKLSAFDGLGVNSLAGVARRAAKQRRERLGAWEVAREKRAAEQDQKSRCEVQAFEEVEYMVGDQDVRLGSPCSERSGSQKSCGDGEYVAYDQGVNKERQERHELTSSMLKRRECKGSEGVRERAVKMGWRERSVSEGV
ncbi:hypothetical protein IFR05_003197 [Cadophora sp. M221]|nr:hypothetical protein IFR05_003197 [Cadophora sp. M221]